MLKLLVSIFLVVILTGCAGGPGAGGFQAAKGEAFYGFRGDQLHFLIVSDGSVGAGGYGVDNMIIRGPRWSGSITPVAGDPQDITFCAGRGTIRIGKESFRLSKGRFFKVTTSAGQATIQQLNISPREQIESLLSADKRLRP